MKSLHIPPRWLKVITEKHLVWQFPAGSRKIFLSFDDGPTPGLTSQIAGILNQFGAKATFFLMGKNAFKYPELVRQIASDGHAIGNHGWHHVNGWLTGTAKYLENIQKANQVISGNLFRPPYGRITPAQIQVLKNQGINIIMWSVLVPDYANLPDLKSTLKKTISQTTDGSIVVFHDNPKAAKNCLALLPGFLNHFINLGFSFEIIPQGDNHFKPNSPSANY